MLQIKQPPIGQRNQLTAFNECGVAVCRYGQLFFQAIPDFFEKVNF